MTGKQCRLRSAQLLPPVEPKQRRLETAAEPGLQHVLLQQCRQRRENNMPALLYKVAARFTFLARQLTTNDLFPLWAGGGRIAAG